MARRDWTRDELLLVMNLYCQITFGRMHKGNPLVKQLAAAIGRTPSSVAMKLVNLASLDPAHQKRGVKGLSGASNADRQIWSEFHEDWERLAVESEELRIERGLPIDAAKDPEDQADTNVFGGPTESSRVVKVRLAQRFFRKTVMASYAQKCCITEISHPAFLIASHILPWSEYPEHRTDPRNGLCLSRLHDAAFDRHLITFDEDFRLVISSDLRSWLSNQVLNDSFARFEGKPLRLPWKFLPSPVFLNLHRHAFQD